MIHTHTKNAPLVAAERITKKYTSGPVPLVVLKDASFTLDVGEFVTISGPSGAGKSTLLHVLGALDRPSAGKVMIEGTSLYDLSDKSRARVRNRTFGFVFQFYHLMPEFTALENVMLPAMVARAPLAPAQKRAMALLDAVDLYSRAHHYPNQLSGGEQQRVAIARALLNEPRVLFADEPTGNLDSDTSDRVMGLLQDLHRTQRFAFVMVTHNTELAQLGSRCYYLHNGTLTVTSSTHSHYES